MERRNRSVIEMARSMMKSMEVPDSYYGEKRWSGKKPNLEHLRVFGCVAHSKVLRGHQQKLDSRSEMLVHLGTETGSKAYRLLDPVSGRIRVSRDVRFDEAIMTQNCISDLHIGAQNKILEARVYRKWLSKKPQRPTPLDYCCILIDREGNAIQANMGTDAIAYFNSILQPDAAYRISHFTCVPASKYQQTLENQTSLKFGRYTKFENIPAQEYQKHYFNFTAYNQLGSKLNQQSDPLSQTQTTLTDYIGCLTRVGDVERFGRPGGNQYVLRKLDIENLSGDVIELTLWDETAENFQKAEYESMQKPVIIAVSSCKVTEYAHNLQLTATSATFYYLNPEIPELGDLIAEFTAKYDLKPLLEISKTRYKDLEKEKTRNRFPISTLLQENPDTYKAVRFTAEATIIRINTARDWYYVSCNQCIKMLIDGYDTPTCPDHGPQSHVTYRYNFKAFLSDHSATATFTFFTPNAEILTGVSCPDLVTKYNTPNQRDFPQEILELAGRHHIFQFHYNPYCSKGRVDFYFDDILDKPLQITNPSTAKLQTPGKPSSSAEGTLLLELPDTHNPSTPAAAIPIRQIPLPSPPSAIKEATTLTSPEVIVSPASTDETTTMGDVHETHKTKNNRANTLKRHYSLLNRRNRRRPNLT
ncbi:nucleic acid-binding, OB-fold protein, partial [Tanacetum coccineum]